jgi:hypothetical protein
VTVLFKLHPATNPTSATATSAAGTRKPFIPRF